MEVEAAKRAEGDDDKEEEGDAPADGEEASPEKVPNDEEAKEDGDGAEEAKPEEKEEPIHVDMDGDSDEDFIPIAIKEKVKHWKKDHSGRLPEILLNEMVRWRLFQNDCQNRGYVLDGYPRNYH